MYKVIHVVSDTNIGGAGKVVLLYAKFLKEPGIELKVVVPRGSALVAALEGASVIEADGIADASLSMEGIKSMTEIFRRERPDIVHTHAGLSARIAARLLGIKIVITRHWIGQRQKGGMLNNLLCDCAIGVSEDVAGALLANGISKSKVRVVENAVEIPPPISAERRRALRKKFGVRDDCVIVGMAARLEEVKGHRYVIEAAKALANENAVFLIAGEGSLQSELRALASGMKNLCFIGFVPQVTEFFQAMDIHVLASREEAFSLSALEAMAAGAANIVTPCGGITNKLVNNETALIVEYGDAKALGSALKRLITEQALRQKIGGASKELALHSYSVDKMMSDTVKIYRELLKK